MMCYKTPYACCVCKTVKQHVKKHVTSKPRVKVTCNTTTNTSALVNRRERSEPRMQTVTMLDSRPEQVVQTAASATHC